MKTFTLDEARQILPDLRNLLVNTNEEFDELAQRVRNAATRYHEAEAELDRAGRSCRESSEIERLRICRDEFQTAFQQFVREQKIFLDRLDGRVAEITTKGVVLRNLREGLVDFPAEKNGFQYFLCWRMAEDDISHWHLTSDGFTGRRPLICLLEYC